VVPPRSIVRAHPQPPAPSLEALTLGERWCGMSVMFGDLGNIAAAATRRTWLPLVAFSVLLTGCATPSKPKSLSFTATAYSSGHECNGPWGPKNAVGQPLRSGKVSSAAADWSRLPLGTVFRVRETGKTYVVDDYGSAMVGRDKVDLFKTDYGSVYRWGVRRVTLDILEWGCPDRSLQVLRPRSKYAHVRAMVEALEEGASG
jgi:3D (Asp-Asp-Asp) domain-containing protein